MKIIGHIDAISLRLKEKTQLVLLWISWIWSESEVLLFNPLLLMWIGMAQISTL